MQVFDPWVEGEEMVNPANKLALVKMTLRWSKHQQ